jgi:hypothetical protein
MTDLFLSLFIIGGDSAADTKQRAGTIIHEATHYLSYTGDHVNNGQVQKGWKSAQPGWTTNGGCMCLDFCNGTKQFTH